MLLVQIDITINAGQACRAIVHGLLSRDLTPGGLKLYVEQSHSSATSLHTVESSDTTSQR